MDIAPSFLPRSRPFRLNVRIGLRGARRVGAPDEARTVEPPERPDGGAADERRSIAQRALGPARQRGIAGVSDRDQLIAQKPDVADALDRTARKQRAEG